MKKILLLFLLLSVKSFSQSVFQKTFGTPAHDTYGYMTRAHDGGYVIAGSSFGFASSYADIFIYKMDSAGNMLWNNAFIGRRADESYSICATSDGGYAILIETNSVDTTNPKMLNCLIKTDSVGHFLWSKAYDVLPSIYYNYPKNLIETSDHGFLFVGGTQGEDKFAVKTNSAGHLLWAYAYDLGVYYSAYELSNGDFLMLGYSRNYPGPQYRMILTKINAQGNPIWSKLYLSTANEMGLKIISADSSGIMVAGQTVNSGQGALDFFLMSLDTSGHVQWGETYGGGLSEYFSDAIKNPGGGYLLFGGTQSFIFGTTWPDVYAVRTDPVGNYVWARHYGSVDAESEFSVLPTSEHGFMMAAGNSNLFGLGLGDEYIIKTDSLGSSLCREGATATIAAPYTVADSIIIFTKISGGVEYDALWADSIGLLAYTECFNIINNTNELPGTDFHFTLFPNPAHDELTIAFSGVDDLYPAHPVSNVAKQELRIFDATGRTLIQKTNLASQLRLDVSSLADGIYFVQFTAGDLREMKKFIKVAD